MEYTREQFEYYTKEREGLKANIARIKEYLNRLNEQLDVDAAKGLEEFYKEEASDIADIVAGERNLDSNEKAIVRGYLDEEAKHLAFFYEKQFRQGVKGLFGKIAMFSRNIASGTMTLGDVWHQLWSNIWNLIFGPWVVGSFFVFLQFLLISNYVPASAAKPFLQIMAPLIVGGGVFFLNFMSSKNPMDWLTHIISGFLIAFTFAILWIGIFGSIESFPGGVMWFWIAWGLSCFFIGTFSLYQLGGFRVVMQVAVIVLLFGYIALGPYKAAYREAIDKIKEPFTLAFRAVITAFQDAWILATNPTEWYARQQLRNMRSESPLESPKGVEIIKIESLTPNVGIPHGEEFEIYAIIQNKGRLDASVIEARIECNEYCSIKGDAARSVAMLEQGEQTQLRFSRITATKPGRSAFEMAKITLFVSYKYNTSTSLPVTVASEAEITRRLSSREDVFKPVVSKAMDSPAQISLNVGPQPLKTGAATTLLVAITNARPDGTVVLKEGMKLLISVPEGLGSIKNLDYGSDKEKSWCRSNNVVCNAKDMNKNGKNDQLECSVKMRGGYEKLQITAADFSSILPIFCGFDNTAEGSVNVFKSEMITAELQSYIYEVKKTLDVTVTQPLGIAKAPTPAASPSGSPTATPAATPTPTPTATP